LFLLREEASQKRRRGGLKKGKKNSGALLLQTETHGKKFVSISRNERGDKANGSQ